MAISAGALRGRTRRFLRRHAAQRAGRGDVAVAGLISPYRYDVVVRAQFFSFLADRPDLAGGDAHDVLAAIGDQPYATWFRSLALARFHPKVAAQPGRAERALLTRIRSARAMVARAERGGFADMPPITARVTAPGARTDSGIALSPQLQLVDGGHRLALLALSGSVSLPPERYRVFAAPTRQVLDNTAALLRPLGISRARYLLYVSLGLTGQPQIEVDDLLADVAQAQPDRLTELHRVLDRHLPLLSETDTAGALPAIQGAADGWRALLSTPGR